MEHNNQEQLPPPPSIKNNYFTSLRTAAKIINPHPSDIKNFQLNVRGLSDLTKFGKLCSALATFSFQFDVIVLSEVKIKSTFPVKLYNINGYNQFSSLRTERGGGGLVVFIKQEFTVEEIPPTPNKFEKLNLSFKRAEMKMRMLAYYRAPSTNVKDFLEDLET